ncbi:MAG: hypothetical protein Q9160_004928 [Pyrenula sp. 1 TL-2023]
MAMSGSQQHQQITPPQRFTNSPLTPPSTDEKEKEKAFKQASRVIAHFKARELGKGIDHLPWTEFQLVRGEYREIERRLEQDMVLLGYVKHKLRYDYFAETYRLAVRMPLSLHERFCHLVEREIERQLTSIRCESGSAATFAQKVCELRSTSVFFPSISKSKHDPDSSFQHRDAKYPGVIIEVSYSQKRKSLRRLAEDYLLDSNANIQVVVGLDIEYGEPKKGLRKATLSVWRTHIADGQELKVVQEIKDEVFSTLEHCCLFSTSNKYYLQAFRDDQGNPTGHSGLRLQLVDFAPKSLQQGVEAREISITNTQLCQYLADAEDMVKRRKDGVDDLLPPGVRKRQRSETPPEAMTSDTEAWYARQEEKDAERAEQDDLDYRIHESYIY